MRELHKYTYEISELLESKVFNNIKDIKCLEEEDNYELSIIMNTINIKIITNFNNYMYVKSNDFDTNELNLHIVYKSIYKSIFKTLYFIDEYKLIPENIVNIKSIQENIKDNYNFYNKIEEKVKYYIDFSLYENIINNLKKPINNLRIPINLLLNGNQINKRIINEIKKFNTNFDFLHYIKILDDLYTLEANLFLDNNIIVKIKIILNSELYPFYPPSLEIISPQVSIILYLSIINLNIIKINNWNCTMSLEWLLTNLATKLNPIIVNYINQNEYSNLELNIIKINNILNESISCINFDIIKKVNTENINYWKSGTGYGNSLDKDNWNINDYIKEKEIKNIEISNYLEEINNLITNDNLIKVNDLLNSILNITSNLTLLEVNNLNNVLDKILKLLSKIITFDNFKLCIKNDFIKKLVNNLNCIYSEINTMLTLDDKVLETNELYQNIYNVYQIYNDLVENEQQDNNIISNENTYCEIMSKYQFEMIDFDSSHLYNSEKLVKIDSQTIKRIISEISSLKNNLPINYNSTIWVRFSKTNLNIFSFLIAGPEKTPYHNGLFEFHACFPNGYPNSEPKVLLKTTGGGSVRFNPNLYANGKVCLSLLGTWNSSNESETWNSKTSTILQVLISIQSLIFVDDPYFNEPGYEKTIGTIEGNKSSEHYNNNIKKETLKWAIINQLKNPSLGYEEVIKNHFKIKKDEIIKLYSKYKELTEELNILIDELN